MHDVLFGLHRFPRDVFTAIEPVHAATGFDQRLHAPTIHGKTGFGEMVGLPGKG
jgi:hypothetical protein